uniref:Uncharacterized protein n=1 Tax=Avena sativa TaxID=4498 RepID=A0ACD5X041_AVESA
MVTACVCSKNRIQTKPCRTGSIKKRDTRAKPNVHDWIYICIIMQVSRKAKVADGGGGAGGRERLSQLPDCLLHIILSHLKARQVVQTCVLSRRWQKLWLTSLCLDIDSKEFPQHAALPPGLHQVPHPAAFGQPLSVYYAPPYEFEDFVDCLLVHRSAGGRPPLDTLRLSIPPWWTFAPRLLSGLSNEIKHTAWVRRGLKCTPAALDVSGYIKLPALTSPGTDRLTKLRLHRVILHPLFAEHLNSGLPVLEDLEISRTDLSGLSTIASGTLKHLVVDSASDITMVKEYGSLAFRIVAPRLVSLHLAVQFRRLGLFGVIVQDAPRLVRASIRLVDKPELRQRQGGYYYYYAQDDRALVKSLRDLLGSVSHVRTLELYGFHDM